MIDAKLLLTRARDFAIGSLTSYFYAYLEANNLSSVITIGYYPLAICKSSLSRLPSDSVLIQGDFSVHDGLGSVKLVNRALLQNTLDTLLKLAAL